MSDNSKGFVTKGTAEYFAAREQKIEAHIVEATTQIAAIEGRMRAELAEITTLRDQLRTHLDGFLKARNALAKRRDGALAMVAELHAIVGICDTQLPVLDEALDALEGEYIKADKALDATENAKQRQLNKHTRQKAKYEGRKARLALRKRIVGVGEPQDVTNKPLAPSANENESSTEATP